MADLASGWILPDLDDEHASGFWEATARGELCVQRCTDCGARRMPPRPMCPQCQSLSAEWEALSGRGTIWSFVVPHPPLLPAYGALAPYVAVVVELDEDPSLRMAGNLVASPEGPINEIDPASVAIGDRVQVVFAQVEDVTLPRWTPA